MPKAKLIVCIAVFLLCMGWAGIAAAQEMQVRGRVVDAEGAGVGMVTVMLEVQDMRIRREVHFDKTRTMVDGSFTFDLSKYENVPSIGMQFNTVSPRHRETLKIIVAEKAEFPVEVVLEVRPGSVARGVVVDKHGKPMEGADVFAAGTRPVETDKDGRFELFGLPADGSATIIGRQTGYVDAREMIMTSGPELIEELRLVLEPANRLEGTALDPKGKPLHRAAVFLQIPGRHLKSEVDAEGAFVFEAVPENLEGITVALLHQDFPRRERALTAQESAQKKIILRTQWPVNFSGEVKTQKGDLLGGCEVIVSDGKWQNTRRAPTDAEGRFLVGPAAPGKRYSVTVLPPTAQARYASGELSIIEETAPGRWKADVNPWPQGYVSVIEMEVEGDQVRMTRRDSGKGGMPGVVRYVGTLDEKKSAMKGTVEVEMTGAKGEFTATSYDRTGKLKGMWDLREQFAAGNQLFAPSQMRVSAPPFPGTQVTELTLSEPKSLTGHVLLETGRPLLRGTVTLDRWNGSDVIRHSAEIMAGGKFSFSGLPDGTFRLVVVGEEGGLVMAPKLVRPGLPELELKVGEAEEDPIDPL